MFKVMIINRIVVIGLKIDHFVSKFDENSPKKSNFFNDIIIYYEYCILGIIIHLLEGHLSGTSKT